MVSRLAEYNPRHGSGTCLSGKRTEPSASISEERFRLVAQATNDVLWDWDLVTNAHW